VNPKSKKVIALVLLAGLPIGINGYVFVQSLQPGNEWLYSGPGVAWASDFSAFYDAAWALIHNPSSVYGTHNYPVNDSQDFRYPPWFLFFVLPFVFLPFPTAQASFELLQFLLLPLIALLVIKIIDPRNRLEFFLLAVVLLLTLLEPFVGTTFSFTMGAFQAQYSQGQSKVLELFLIMASLYLAKKGSWAAPVLLLLSAFDPRFSLMALPLFLYFFVKSKSYVNLVYGVVLSIVILLPFPFYYHLAGQFLHETQYKLLTFYAYEWVLFYPILALTLAVFLVELNKKLGTGRLLRTSRDKGG